MAYETQGGRGALQGLGEGIQHSADTIMAYMLRQANLENTRDEALVKDFGDKVSKGELDPDQAQSAMVTRGVNVPPGFFHALAPTVQSKLASAMGMIDNAKSVSEVPSPNRIGAGFKAQRLPLITPGPIDPNTGANATRLSPELSQVLTERQDKLNAFPAVRVPGVYNPITKTNEEQFIPAREANQARTFQTSPTPEQSGVNTGTSTTAATRTENQQGLPELKAEGANILEDLTRTGKAQTAGATTAASTQARINTETAPGNVQKEGTREAAIASMKKEAEDAIVEKHVPPEIARSFIQTTKTGIPYFYAESTVPKEYLKVGMEQAVKKFPGIRVLDRQQHDAMQQIDIARSNVKMMLDTFMTEASKTAAARMIEFPKVTIDMMLQNNPEIVGAFKASYGAMVENFRATTAGVPGFRMTQFELQQANDARPLPTDTYATMIAKTKTLADIFSNIERRAVGIDKPLDQQ